MVKDLNRQKMDYVFFGFKYDDNKTAVDNCLAIDGLAQELHAIGEEIKNDWIISRILNSLPERFSHFHSAWDSTASTDKTISKLMERLQQEEQRIKLRDGNSVENALFSKGKNNKQNKTYYKKNSSQSKGNQNQSSSNYNNKCFKCGKVGHQKSQCHGKPCQEYLDYCKRNYKCNNCHEVGHFIKECPKLEKQNAKAFISVALSVTEIERISDDCKSWYQDSGATHHMTGNLNWMSNLTTIENPATIILGDSTELKSYNMGDVHMTAYNGKEWYPIVLQQVLYVPELTFNLFSLTTALDKGYTQQANASQSVILENNNPVLIADRTKGLFRMRVSKNEDQCLTAVSIKDWHKRLAHQNVTYVRDILKRNNIKFIDDWNGYVCEGCAYGKQCRTTHKTNPNTATECLDVIHVDLGEMNDFSLGGAKYFLLFKDDFSHYRTIYFLKNKSEAVDKLNNFLKLVNNQFGRQVKTLKSDNGKEIKNTESRKILEELGIFHERSAKYTPEQNGRIEREMRTIVEAARAELHTGNLSKQLWAEAMNYSVFTVNRTGTSSVKGKSPAELWFGCQVSIKSMKPFRCKCYILIPNRDRKKLDKKSQKGIFVGYDLEETGYRIYIPDKRKIEISCDVVFDEKLNQNFNSTEVFLDRKMESLQEEKHVKNSENEEHVSQQEESHDTESSDEESFNSVDEMDEDLQIPDEREKQSQNTPQRVLRDRKILRPPNRYDPCASNFTALIGDVEEISVEDALNNPQWKRAMDDEMHSLDKTHTWLLTELPEGRKVLSNRWVFRIKDDGKMKARLVARGYDQQQGTDYFETFSPVVRHASIRLLLSFAVKEYKHVRTFDIKTAFLNGDLTEDIYMSQPQGYDDGSGKVCKLLKSLYGLKPLNLGI